MGFHWVSRRNGVYGEGQRGRGRVRVRHRPSVGIEESDPTITGSPVKICARAATVGVAVETDGGGKGSGASRRWQCLPHDRTRVRRWGCGGGSEPRIKSCFAPHPLYRHCAMGAH